MGLYSAKKPYHNLKASIASFYKQRVLFMKQLLQKLSEFEKPYIDSSYPEMNLKIPEPNWPTWVKPYIPNPWHPEISLEPLPPIPAPGPTPSPWPPPDSQTGGCGGGCSVEDMPAYSAPGDVISLWITGPWCSLEGKTVSKAMALLSVTGPGKLTIKHGKTPFVTVLIIDEDAIDEDVVCVESDTSPVSGQFGSIDYQSCGACTIVEAPNCPEEGVEIEYTTLVMTGGSSQTLQSSDGKEYWWWVTDIEGNTTKTKGKTKVITAPTSNPGCETIEVSLRPSKSEDAEECDSVSINVTIADCEDYGPSFIHCCSFSHPEFPRQCQTSYDCEGIWVLNAASNCCYGHTSKDCSDIEGCELGSFGCAFEVAGDCPAGEWEDVRSEAAIEAGCCPGL